MSGLSTAGITAGGVISSARLASSGVDAASIHDNTVSPFALEASIGVKCGFNTSCGGWGSNVGSGVSIDRSGHEAICIGVLAGSAIGCISIK